MRNPFDFYDCVSNWRSNIGSCVVEEPEAFVEDDLGGLFDFDFSDIECEESCPSDFKELGDQSLRPVIYLSGVRYIGCSSREEFDRLPVDLTDFNYLDELNMFLSAFEYYDVVDCDGFDFDEVNEVLSSDDAFQDIQDRFYSTC